MGEARGGLWDWERTWKIVCESKIICYKRSCGVHSVTEEQGHAYSCQAQTYMSLLQIWNDTLHLWWPLLFTTLFFGFLFFYLKKSTGGLKYGQWIDSTWHWELVLFFFACISNSYIVYVFWQFLEQKLVKGYENGQVPCVLDFCWTCCFAVASILLSLNFIPLLHSFCDSLTVVNSRQVHLLKYCTY